MWALKCPHRKGSTMHSAHNTKELEQANNDIGRQDAHTINIRRIVRKWAVSRLSNEVVTLIAMAGWDLSFGPFTAAEFSEACPNRKTAWPGWGQACDTIQIELSELPSVVWVDVDGEWCVDEEPVCGECEGTGGDYGLELGTTYKLERDELVSIVVGRDLAGYFR
jgi:hypothetical protein